MVVRLNGCLCIGGLKLKNGTRNLELTLEGAVLVAHYGMRYGGCFKKYFNDSIT